MSNGYTSECSGSYWCYPPISLIFDIQALSTERQSAQMSKKLKGGLDLDGSEHYGRLIFATIRKV